MAACGTGLPVSAKVTRPMMTLAGSMAAVIDVGSAAASVSTRIRCRANLGSSAMSETRRSRPMPRIVNRPSAPVIAGRGQAGVSLRETSAPEMRAAFHAVGRSLRAASGDDRWPRPRRGRPARPGP